MEESGRKDGEPRMKLTRAASYALHAMAHMASQKTNQTLASHEVARARRIPASTN